MKYPISIIFLLFGFSIMSFQSYKKPSTKDKLPTKWLQLNRTENGYVIYQPCDGSTQSVTIRNLTLTINRQMESEQHNIDSVTQLSDTIFIINCDKGRLNFSVRWIDHSKTKALWKTHYKDSIINNDNRWVMCPAKSKDRFPLIDNPCPTEKIKEKEFLPVDIN